MSTRWTLALLALAAALGGWVYFGEIRGDARKQEAEAAAKKIFGVESASVTALELTLAGGGVARIARDGASDWRVESPVAYPADRDAVERALKALEKVTSTATISPAPADLAPFGLGPAGKKVRVFIGGSEPQELAIGGPTPVGGGKYVSLASDPARVFAVDAGGLYGLAPTLVELRDKRLLRVATGSIDGLDVSARGAAVVHAKKSEAGWQLTAPEAADADAARIQRLLDELALARATDFADSPTKAETDGLAKPELELAIHAADKEERLTFARVDDKVWLRRGDDPVLLAVNAGVIASVPTLAFDYREKRVLTLVADEVKSLELSYPRTGESHRFDLKGEEWKPAEAGVEVRPLKVEDLLFAIAGLDATGIESQTADRKALGLEPALVRMRALGEKDAELGVLSLGDASVDRGLPAVSSQNAGVWRVANDLGEQVPLTPEAFKIRWLKAAATPNQ